MKIVKVSPICLQCFPAAILVYQGGTLTWHVHTVLCKSRRISEVWGKARAKNLEKCLIYLLYTISYLFPLDDFRFIFYYVTVKEKPCLYSLPTHTLNTFPYFVGELGHLPFTQKNRKFQLENQMVCAIPFGKLQKIWAVIWGDAIFFKSL